MSELPPHVTCGTGVTVEAESIQCGQGVRIGDRVAIRAKRIILGDGAVIDADTEIRADHFQLDAGARIERRCVVSAIRGPATHIHLGENSVLGHDGKVLVPVLVAGDFVAIQNHALINGLKPVRLGHNTWVGQNCILNANDHLAIGNNVGIGPYSSVYTHGFFGDLLEGCQVNKVAPVTIEDDAWIVGSYNVISPGVTLGKKALVLTGSNVTRDVPANHCVGGSPATDLTARFEPFRPRTATEKLAMMRGFLKEYVEDQYPGRFEELPDGYAVVAGFGGFRLLCTPELRADTLLPPDRPLLVFTGAAAGVAPPARVTIFDLVERTYTRTRTAAEIRTIAWLKNPRARFVPTDRPEVRIPPGLI